MKLTVNPFTLVIKADGVLHFILSDHTHPVQLTPDAARLDMLEKMYDGAFYAYDELCGAFGKAFVDELVKAGCLVGEAMDTQSMYSRTNAFFMTHRMPDARAALSDKKVLILGCGGIGTHMAWHMATLGVQKITLVDFDTVEISNLNRQLLFDKADAGKIKTEVLKGKLEAINQEVVVETVHARISSEQELEQICLREDYALIIKALDSPAAFPVWLDNVARKHALTYIAGITMRENVLIGPSFIPGKTNCGWSDLMDVQGGAAEKMYGTAPSLGLMLYHISDELAIEAFKILTGYGQPKYMDKILCKNVVTDEEYVIQKNASMAKKEDSNVQNGGWQTPVLNLVLMIVLAVAGTQGGRWIPVAFLAAMVTPFLMYTTSQQVVRCTFINATVFSVGLLVRCVSALDLSTVGSLVSSLVLLFGIHSAVALAACVINYVVCAVLRRDRRKG